MGILKPLSIAILTSTIVACGGGGNGSSNTASGSDASTSTPDVSTPLPALIIPTDNTTNADTNGLVTVAGRAAPGSTITVTFPDGSQEQTTANSTGEYSLTSTAPQNSGEVSISSANSDGVSTSPAVTDFKADLDSVSVLKALYKSTGEMPELSFSPSLGINTEAPQGGVDTAGLAMPFADIFRTARPFAELSPSGTAFDEHGWPIKFAENSNFARTKLLQGAVFESIPEGQYTIIYEGDGTLEMGTSEAVSDFTRVAGENKYTFNLILDAFDSEDEVAAADTNSISMNIRGTENGSTNTLRNIRMAMPGGTCSGNPYLRVDSQNECPSGAVYESFADRLEADRNAIIFNPEYLLFLRNFKVVRMMNLMESSLKKLCFNAEDCPEGVGTWDHKAELDDAVWGGNDGRTPDEDHLGVPIEVMVALANTIERDIWVNMPHVATNDYVKNYAKFVNDNLNPDLQVYIEYSNEVWNPGFAAHNYAVSQGTSLGLNTVPEEFEGSVNRDADYFARLRYYSQRSEEIFILWKREFEGSEDTRLVRVLGSFIGDRVLTEQMIKNIVNINNVDAVAIAPYFFGCPVEAQCIDAPKNLLTATTIDDIFDILDQPADIDVKSIEGTIESVKNQLTVTSANNLKLVSYEGGQHLVTGVFGSNIEDEDKPRLRRLFNEANRDPRMKQRYINFLNGWRDLTDDGTTLFTLYTLPQSYYRFGNFGIAEHLNQSREDAPKLDGVMTFQEIHKECWWDGCNP